MDVTLSLLFVVVFSPLYLLIMLIIKLTSPGPVFYTQERMGLDGKLFKCIKFRGMYQNAEQSLGPVWAKKNDSRVTAVGKFLRKTSLDELPQFFNVLKGEMSIVGPRPERPYFVNKFKKEIPGYILRHKMKSGITGWAQVNGWRGQTSLEKRIEYDLWYIQNWSLWLDIKIMVLTPIKGFFNPHAY
jgi:exopolysaccharide biosynthesis polyprenyl glycosylphosphotransferase